MADNKSKLYITISDERGGGTPTPGPTGTDDGGKKEQEKSGMLGRYAEHEMFHLVKNTALKTVNYTLGNIGNFTGDYITQRKVNYAKGVISNIMKVGQATISGAMMGGPVGALIGFGIGTANIVVDSVFEFISNTVETAKQNYEIDQLRIRAGLNTTYDGSRGTEN